MSMRHHWQELDELLAQLDREARFKRGPFRPGLKALRPVDDVAAHSKEYLSTLSVRKLTAAESDSPAAEVFPVKKAKPSADP